MIFEYHVFPSQQDSRGEMVKGSNNKEENSTNQESDGWLVSPRKVIFFRVAGICDPGSVLRCQGTWQKNLDRRSRPHGLEEICFILGTRAR
jgi:hypothetical protein